MADKPKISENFGLLRQIVAERGFWGYRSKYRLILESIINDKTVYEELSDENKTILHYVTGLNEDEVKTFSELMYGKPKEPDEEETAEPSTPQTRIGCVLSLIQHRGARVYQAFPEEKRQDALGEYILFLRLSLKMLSIKDNAGKGRDLFFEFRYALKKYIQETYPEAKHDGLLHLFDGNVIIDLTLFDIALRMDKTRERMGRDVISPFLKGYFTEIQDYDLFRGPGYSCKTMDEFCERCTYVDFTFPDKNIEKFFSVESNYISVRNLITADTLNSLNARELEQYKDEAKHMLQQIKAYIGGAGQWENILRKMLEELPAMLNSHKSNSAMKGLNDKMKIYLLDLLTSNTFNGAMIGSPIERIYANIIERSEGPVHTSRGRVSKDKTGVVAVTGTYLYHYNNLGYSRYSERVRNLEAVYNLLDALDDGVYSKKTLIDALVQDLIPYEKDKKSSMETLKTGGFRKIKLQHMVEKAIDDYYEKPPKTEV